MLPCGVIIIVLTKTDKYSLVGILCLHYISSKQRFGSTNYYNSCRFNIMWSSQDLDAMKSM